MLRTEAATMIGTSGVVMGLGMLKRPGNSLERLTLRRGSSSVEISAQLFSIDRFLSFKGYEIENQAMKRL